MGLRAQHGNMVILAEVGRAHSCLAFDYSSLVTITNNRNINVTWETLTNADNIMFLDFI